MDQRQIGPQRFAGIEPAPNRFNGFALDQEADALQGGIVQQQTIDESRKCQSLLVGAVTFGFKEVTA